MMMMMIATMTFGTTVEARGRERARWSPREVTCEGTEREGARRVVETAASLFDDAFGAVRDVEDGGAGRARGETGRAHGVARGWCARSSRGRRRGADGR